MGWSVEVIRFTNRARVMITRVSTGTLGFKKPQCLGEVADLKPFQLENAPLRSPAEATLTSHRFRDERFGYKKMKRLGIE